MSEFSSLFASQKKQYRKLNFCTEPLEKTENIRMIPTEEKILVTTYLRDTVKDKEGVIITDHAIWLFLSQQTIQIPLSDICHYFIYQESLTDGIHFFSAGGQYVLLTSHIGCRTNETAREIKELLHTMQRNLRSMESHFQQDYDKVLAVLKADIRTSMHENGILTGKYEILFGLLEMENPYVGEVVLLHAQNLYRMCDTKLYFHYVDSLEEKISPELLKKLKQPASLFFEDFLKDITNPYSFFITRNLVYAYLNLKQSEPLTVYQSVLLACLCVRMEDRMFLPKLLHDNSKAMGEKNVWEIGCFAAKFQNEKMSRIYNSIISEKKISASELQWQDSLGLTPLHYALLLRDWKTVKLMLQESDWTLYRGPFSENDEMRTLYSFSFLASEIFENPKMMEEVFVHTSKLARPFLKAIQKYHQYIEINRALGRMEKVKEYEKAKKDMQHELSVLCEATMYRCQKKSQKMHQNGNPMIQTVLALYNDKSMLFDVLTQTISDWKIYRFENRFFVMKADSKLPYSFYEWKNQKMISKKILSGDELYSWNKEEQRQYEQWQEKTDGKDTKDRSGYEETTKETVITRELPYGKSWFSEDAHRNPEILKREYRILVKKYHPDVSEETDTTEIMQNIMIERSAIYDRLSSF